ncbi:uncharacterized protein OCT59_002706 [Rhizophagus irregularis]|uniref:Uncharacterized protein n=2 Tax=Rhizophagus irregularis TaxID=588596 RepID=A0A015KTC6_RHIIW|nr:hypothetical protein RirG_083420 [Rhizophagus irregularis DAOM 197198w]UZO11132.1 hypothetical protein OCT59_002706 [Rhizophagus irregularis]GBC13786.1 hypothetical protein GLOIN_2v1488631 [Rhizophagus irregularis DAOM 181602=DAOM 197198]CAG8703879.1 17181_t:CDS:1 [Rhizophagus irregularis]
MAPPTSLPSQRTRSETAKQKADSQSDSFAKSSFRENNTTAQAKDSPLVNVNKTLEPKEAFNKRTERKKKQQQIRFTTQPGHIGDASSSPVFLVSSPGMDNNNMGQSVSMPPVNPDDVNKQTNDQPIDDHVSPDQNNAEKSDHMMHDQQPDLPDIEMIVDDPNDVTQVHKLE